MKLSIPAPPKINAAMKQAVPKMSMARKAKAPKPFLPRQRRYNPAPNKSMF